MGVKQWVGICVAAIVIGLGARLFWGILREESISQKETVKVCVVEEEQEHVHDFVKGVWESPTCLKSGYYNNVCRECGLVECVMQEPVPHKPQEILVQEGNCMEDTIIRHICSVCGTQIMPDTYFTENNLHHWVTEQIEGSEVTYCMWCGVVP